MATMSDIEQSLIGKKVFIDSSCFSHNKIKDFLDNTQKILAKSNNHIIVISQIINYFIKIEDKQTQLLLKDYIDKDILVMRGPTNEDIRIDFVELFESFNNKYELTLISQYDSIIKEILDYNQKTNANITVAKITEDGTLEILNTDKTNIQTELKEPNKEEDISFENSNSVEDNLREPMKDEWQSSNSQDLTDKTIKEEAKIDQEVQLEENFDKDYEIRFIESLSELLESKNTFNDTIVTFAYSDFQTEIKPYNLFLNKIVLFDNKTNTKIHLLCTKGMTKELLRNKTDSSLIFAFCNNYVVSKSLIICLGLINLDKEYLKIDIPNANKILFEKEEFEPDSLKLFNYEILTNEKIIAFIEEIVK